MLACVLSCFSHVQLCATLWTVDRQATLSWDSLGTNSGLSCPSPGYLPDPGIETVSLMSPALAPPGKPLLCLMHVYYCSLLVESKLMGPGIFGSLTYPKLLE